MRSRGPCRVDARVVDVALVQSRGATAFTSSSSGLNLMRSLLEAFLPTGAHNAEQIPTSGTSGGSGNVESCEATPNRMTVRPSAWPIVDLRATGDGTALARALARVLVRRALVEESAIGGCTNPPLSG